MGSSISSVRTCSGSLPWSQNATISTYCEDEYSMVTDGSTFIGFGRVYGTSRPGPGQARETTLP